MFVINKTLAIRRPPLDTKPLDILILEKVEELLSAEKRTQIRLFSVDFKELKSIQVENPKKGFRYFRITNAYNQRDK